MPAEILDSINGGPESVKKEKISKELVESYIFTTVRHDFGIYTERLFLRLVELAQREIKGLDFKTGEDIGKVKVGEWGDAELVIPVKDILSGEDDKNYAKAKSAVRALMGKFLEYEDDKEYRATHILNDVDVNKISGKMVIRVNRSVWSAMLDFSKGFRRYELETALKLHGKYSLRIYKLVCTQSSPITYSIADLRQMWGLVDKYKKMDDFVKNTIETAKKELDAVSPCSFDFVLTAAKGSELNIGRRGRKTVTSVTFFPKRVFKNDSADTLRKMVSPSITLGRELTDVLRHKFEFDWVGLKANITLFDIADKNFDLLSFLDGITPTALRAENPQGYVINAIRKHLTDKFGVVFEGSSILIPGDSEPIRQTRQDEPKSLKDILGEA